MGFDRKEYMRKYRINNKDVISNKRKEWREKNREKLLSNLKEWRENNTEHIKEYKVKYREIYKSRRNELEKNRYITDIKYCLGRRLRASLSSALKRKGYGKKSSLNSVIGCDWDFLKEYIESKFIDGMNWENRSEWHIDHIIPLSSAKDDDEIYKLNHYTNLQPLWAKDNIKKSNKILI